MSHALCGRRSQATYTQVTYTHTNTGHIHTRARARGRARTHTRTFMRAYIHTYIHACMHACINACMHACMHTYVYTHLGAVRRVCMFQAMGTGRYRQSSTMPESIGEHVHKCAWVAWVAFVFLPCMCACVHGWGGGGRWVSLGPRNCRVNLNKIRNCRGIAK